MFEVTLRSQFCAAHRLINYHGKCEQFHGHNWKVAVTIQKPKLDASNMVMDFKEVHEILDSLLQQFDHSCLNDISYFKDSNATSERMAYVIYEYMTSNTSDHDVKVAKVEVWEDDFCSAAYIPD